MSVIPCTKEDAIAEVKAQAFQVNDEESKDFGRRLVHCFSGGFGADWDEDKVLNLLENAEEICWVSGIMDHDLAVRDTERIRRFQISMPGHLL